MSYVITILFLAALVFALFWRRAHPNSGSALLGGIAVAVILGGAWQLSRMMRAPDAMKDASREEVSGWALGRRVAADFPQGGTLVVLRIPPLVSKTAETTATRLKGFKDGLGKIPFRLVQAGPDQFGLGSIDPDVRVLKAEGWAAELPALIGAEKEVRAVVSLLFMLDASPIQATGTDLPWYAFDASNTRPWTPLMQDGPVRAVVVYGGSGLPANRPRNMTQEQIFPCFFTMVTKDNLAQNLPMQ